MQKVYRKRKPKIWLDDWEIGGFNIGLECQDSNIAIKSKIHINKRVKFPREIYF